MRFKSLNEYYEQTSKWMDEFKKLGIILDKEIAEQILLRFYCYPIKVTYDEMVKLCWKSGIYINKELCEIDNFSIGPRPMCITKDGWAKLNIVARLFRISQHMMQYPITSILEQDLNENIASEIDREFIYAITKEVKTQTQKFKWTPELAEDKNRKYIESWYDRYD